MKYSVALFAILFFDLIVIMLKVVYASRDSARIRNIIFPGPDYHDMLPDMPDTKAIAGYPKLKIVKMVHHEQQYA